MSQKVFDYRLLRRTPKYPIFSTIPFTIIFFIVYADYTVFNLPMHPVNLRIHELFQDHNTRLPRQKTELTLTAESMPQLSIQEKIDEVAEEVPGPLVPPENVTKGEAPGTADTQLKQFNRAVSWSST
ncbi:unnamed protein product [Prunus armeniaca]|uniref:Uncharacterized protein n=1 Tax=Prunus armeniaca TaxID=36596 RepID=A0A6J5UH63_PRUAR|nr:unnamed protein product [Prunus armeniaca]